MCVCELRANTIREREKESYKTNWGSSVCECVANTDFSAVVGSDQIRLANESLCSNLQISTMFDSVCLHVDGAW